MHKIIALWVHPRSLSTVLERIMIERGEFKIFHEPFAYVYYVHDKKAGEPPDWPFDPDHPNTYPAIKKWILEAAQEKPVCFKDMAYYACDYLMEDADFLNNMVNTFMIREPVKTILSYYTIQPDVSRDEIGYEYLFKLFRRVADLNDNKPPVVISAEDLEDDPQATMKAYCKAVGIPFNAASLNWSQHVPEQWKGYEEWHKDAIESNGIQKDLETFDMTIDDEPRLRSFYEYHLPFYEGMYKYRLKPIKE
ncbi:MAG: hypothetical protein KAS40_22415 [Desulfobacterales bacterium]|nr:hypothetical protein [Desulfobacterales bacterium]